MVTVASSTVNTSILNERSLYLSPQDRQRFLIQIKHVAITPQFDEKTERPPAFN
jgi:hypothetical protein